MALPKALQAASDRADQLLQARQEKAQDTGKEQHQAPAQDQEADTKQQGQQSDQQTEQQQQPSWMNQEASEETWETRYKALHGKYQAEVPRLAQELRELREQNTALKAHVEELRAAPRRDEGGNQGNSGHGDVAGIDFDALAEEYPEDLVAAIKAVMAENAKLKDQLHNVEGSVNEFRSMTLQQKEQAFFAELNKLEPEWQAINEDKSWRSWLATFRPGDGRQWQSVLDEARNAHDAGGVSQVFEAFRSAMRGQAPTQQQPDAQKPPHMPDNITATGNPQGKKVWTKAELDRFWRDNREGLLEKRGMTAQQIAQIEREIDAAWREGRVTAR